MTHEDRLRAAFAAAERGDPERCNELLRPIEDEINRILTTLNETIVAKGRAPLQ